MKSQPGPDNIFSEFLRHLGPTAQKTLLSIYNTFWTRDINIPSDWVKAMVIPIHKKDKPTEDFDSYRPISLTSVLAKTFERMLTTRLKFFLESAEIIEEEQAGFRNGMSTSNSIMKFVHAMKSGFNSKKSSLAVFVDFQGAYDTICRKNLLSKLSMYGIEGRMLGWFGRFLAQRWVKTSWNNIESKYRQSKIGLPQGSVSSPILFNIYVNDLIKRLKEVGDIQVSMFADDLVIWTEASNCRNYQRQRQQLESNMNKALEALQSWAMDNHMIISKSKTMYQLFTLRHVVPDFDLYIDDTKLIGSNKTKYLGVTMDSKLSFSEHIRNIVTGVERRLPILKRLAGAKWGCTQDTLNLTYNTYIKPVLKYGSEILISSAPARMDVLERAQNKALRIITGGVLSTPITALQSYTSIPPIAVEIKKTSC